MVASRFKSVINFILFIKRVFFKIKSQESLPDVLRPGLDVKLATSTILTANCCPV